MEEIQYIGEHLAPGFWGHLLITVSFISALFGSIFYLRSLKTDLAGKIGKVYLLTHVASTFLAIAMLFYIVLNRYYEYHYAYKVANDSLPFKYIFSGFWQDQEGSFLLWMFWHCVLLLILLFHKSKFRNVVLGVILGVEALLASMLLGVHLPLTDMKIGVNPFALLRDVMDIPLFANADYVSLIKGQGLNPLLQNYWNVIHPPTLFLGFASGIVPFAFAISGLLHRDHTGWLKPVLPWTLWAGAILGTGILMGSAWAYEALSFGGYWAWDPVENSSLVPWLLQLAAIHSILISMRTNRNVGMSYLLSALSFVFILYSTFLTRSGILGDTSVHAFTEMGLETQLLLLITLCLAPVLVLYFLRRREFPKVEGEEKAGSKEFWMFIGVLILIFSVVLITFTTSIPVYNKILDAIGGAINYDFTSWHRTAPLDPEAHYNKYQIWVAILIALLSGVSQWLRFKEKNFQSHARRFLTHLTPVIVLSLILSFIIEYFGQFDHWAYQLLLFAGVFAMLSNLEYLLFFLKKRKKQYGSVLSHFGFGLMLVGILFSGYKKRFISNNAFLQGGLLDGISAEEQRINVLLFKDSPMILENYEVTYLSDSLANHNRYFKIKYRELDTSLAAIDSFEINPHIIYSRNFDKIEASNPYSRHFFDKDIFSYIAQTPTIDPQSQRMEEDSLEYAPIELAIGDSIQFNGGTCILDEIYMDPNRSGIGTVKGDILFEAKFKFKPDNREEWSYSDPTIILRGNTISNYPDRMNKLFSKIKWSDDLWEKLWQVEQETQYQSLDLSPGEEINFEGLDIRLLNFSKDIPEDRIEVLEQDIVMSSIIEVTENNIKDTVDLIYLIRDRKPIQLKEYMPNFRLNLKFESLDPNLGRAKILVSRHSSDFKFPFMLAEKAGRKDYIVLQVREFPWINLFWMGTLMMMLGLFYSTYIRRKIA